MNGSRDALSRPVRRDTLRTSRRALPLSLVAAVGTALLMAAGAQAAPVTVGSPLTVAFGSPPLSGPVTFTNSSLGEGGTHVTSPVTGTIVRWRVTQATGGPFKLRVLTPVSGTTYTGAGTSAPQTPSSTATQTFSTNMPIRAGQTIGIDNANTGGHLGEASVPGSAYAFWVPPLADGTTRTGSGSNGSEWGFNADVQPLPSVFLIIPTSGSTAGGTSVTIIGQNFEGTTAVSFGGTPARSFTALSDDVIMAVTPAMSPGTVDVTVKNPGQSPSVAADRFTFVAPAAPKSVKCVVPKLKGKTLKAARKALKKAHCKLGKVKGPKGKKARIKKQKPKAGKVLKAGSKVRVTTKRR